MIVQITPKGEGSDDGWVCRVADDADLTCFEFYVINGCWNGLFVGGVIEVEATERIVDGEFEAFPNHPDALAYVDEVNRQNQKGHYYDLDLDDDEPF